MNVKIYTSAFDPFAVLQNWQKEHIECGSFGATASFVGTMRDFNEGDTVLSMTLEHYPDMTAKQLQDIVDDANSKWALIDALVAHRVGLIHPGDPIVLTACWSTHRVAAFDACRFLIEALKTRAPFWKKETLDKQRSRWVTRNTAD